MKIPTVRNEERSNNQKGEHHNVWIKRKDNSNNYFKFKITALVNGMLIVVAPSI